MVGEADHGAVLAAQLPLALIRDEQAGALGIGQRAQRPRAEQAGPGAGEEIAIDVGGQNRHPPVRQALAQQLVDQHRHRIGLGPGGATGRPDAQPALGLIALDALGQNGRAQRLELLEIAKEEGLADGQFRDQRIEFFVAAGFRDQQIEIGGVIGGSARVQAALEAFGQSVVLVFVIGEAGQRDDPALQPPEVGIARRRFLRAPAVAHAGTPSSEARRRASA